MDTRQEMTAKKAEKLRNVEGPTFKRRITEFHDSVAEKQSVKVVEETYRKLEEAWENLEDKHDFYLMHLEDEEANDAEQWIEEYQNLFSEASCMWTNYIRDFKLRRLPAREKETERHERVILESKKNVASCEFEKSIPISLQTKIATRKETDCNELLQSAKKPKSKRSLDERLNAIQEQFTKEKPEMIIEKKNTKVIIKILVKSTKVLKAMKLCKIRQVKKFERKYGTLITPTEPTAEKQRKIN